MKFDVVYFDTHTTIEPHFCREENCFGSNEDHGFTLEEACKQVADWYVEQSHQWRRLTHYDILYYTGNLND